MSEFDVANQVEVVVIGSTMIDLTTYAPKMPALGETLLGSGFEKSFGGKGANQAVQCSRLGVGTAFIGMVGCDSHGDEYLHQLRNERIYSKFVDRCGSSHTGIASIWVDGNGSNSIVIVPGANLQLPAERVRQSLSTVIEASLKLKVSVFQNEIDETSTLEGLKLSKELGLTSIFNPAPVSSTSKNLVPFCDILCVNEVELALITDQKEVQTESEIEGACKLLLNLGCQSVVVTFGSRGAYLYDSRTTLFHYPAPVVKAIDTVGAGDSFIGCMAANIARGEDLAVAVRKAVKCASISVQNKGAQPSYGDLSTLKIDIHPPKL